MVPVALKKALENLQSHLAAEQTLFLEVDADADGIAAGHIIRTALERKGIEAKGEAILREWVHPTDEPLLLADLALRGKALNVIKKQNVAYALDHHRWDPRAQNYLKAYVNTHLLNVENPARWNTGLLAYIMFKDTVPDLNWLAAASAYADHVYGEHVRALTGFDHILPEIKTVGDALGALAFHPDVDTRRVFKMLEGITSLNEFLDNAYIRRIHTDVEREIQRYVSDPTSHALVYDTGRKIMVIYVNSRYPRIKSPISTILSDRFPNWLVCVMQKYFGRLHVSLRLQNAEQMGIDLGKIAQKIGKEFMGEGGGHKPAAGITLPPSILPDDVINALYRALSHP